jgi:hypothetical protein
MPVPDLKSRDLNIAGFYKSVLDHGNGRLMVENANFENTGFPAGVYPGLDPGPE